MKIELNDEYYFYVANVNGIEINIGNIIIDSNNVTLSECSIGGILIKDIRLDLIRQAQFIEEEQKLILETNKHNKHLGRIVIVRGDKALS